MLDDAAKRKAVDAEIAFLSGEVTEEQLKARYGGLFEAIRFFLAKVEVDVDETLMDYLAKFIVELQGLVVRKADIQAEQIVRTLKILMPGAERIFELQDFRRGEGHQFAARVVLKGQVGESGRFVAVTDRTNAGMREFSIQQEAS